MDFSVKENKSNTELDKYIIDLKKNKRLYFDHNNSKWFLIHKNNDILIIIDEELRQLYRKPITYNCNNFNFKTMKKTLTMYKYKEMLDTLIINKKEGRNPYDYLDDDEEEIN